MDLPRFISGIGSRRRCTFWLLALSAATASALTGGCQRNAGPAVAGAVWQTEPADLDPNGDADGDALDDTLEDRLAERFAPIVFHGDRETAFPVSVETWLRHSSLGLAVNGRWVRRVVGGPLTQPQLVNQRTSVGEVALASTGARSRGKRESFVLEPIEAVNRPGPLDSTDWVTYVHSYRNGHDGVTLQYWRAYVRNDASVLGVDLGHGGDWEAIAVHLDARYQPVRTTYLDHSGIVDVTTSMKWEGSHPLVWSEEGSHSSSPDATRSGSTRWYRQETWTGGVVTRWDAVRLGASGGLRNVGEKSHPRNRQLFIRYSGLWGPPGRLFITSGYWGPAFNETVATCADGSSAYRPYLWRRADSQRCSPIRINAWCDGADPTYLDLRAECFALSDVP